MVLKCLCFLQRVLQNYTTNLHNAHFLNEYFKFNFYVLYTFRTFNFRKTVVYAVMGWCVVNAKITISACKTLNFIVGGGG
jgi:hypothetical protein